MGIGIPTLYLYQDLQKRGVLQNAKSVVELGSQDLYVDQKEVKSFLASSYSRYLSADVTARMMYQAIGFDKYTCIDCDGKHQALPLDLNKDLVKDYGLVEQFDLVTNHGTSEHCFNQQLCFTNIHNLCRVGGVMVHVLPGQGYINHCFYNYHPSFFMSLAAANGYELVNLYVSSDKAVDPSLMHLHCLMPYCIELMNYLFTLAGPPEIGLYVVLKKVRDSAFVTPFDNHYINIGELPAQYAAQRTGLS